MAVWHTAVTALRKRAVRTSVTLLSLVLSWVTVRGMPSLYITSYPGQLSFLHSAGFEMTTGHGHNAVMLCGWEVNAGMAHSICGLKVWVAGKTVILVNT